MAIYNDNIAYDATGFVYNQGVFPEGSANLGSLTATATSLVINPVGANASLGGSYSSANAIVSVIATGDVLLGSLTATATAVQNSTATANSNLGELSAQIVTVAPNEGGSFGNSIMAFVQPNFEPPKIDIPVIKPVLPKINYGFADALFGRAYANALSQIDFSIVEDDAEILAMI